MTSSIDKIPLGCKVHLSKLPRGVTGEDVKSLFAEHIGDVLTAEIIAKPPSGRGIIKFASLESADAAVDRMDDFEWKGCKIKVAKAAISASKPPEAQPFIEKSEPAQKLTQKSVSSEATKDSQTFKAVYLSNITWEATKEELEALFVELVAKPIAIRMFKDNRGKPRGCATVTFASHDQAQKAIDKVNNHEFKARRILVVKDNGDERDDFGKFLSKKNTVQASSKVYVSNLHHTMTQIDVKNLFTENVAPPKEIHLYTNENGKPLGSCLVTLANVDLAKKAVEKLDKTEVKNWKINVQIDIGIKRDSHGRVISDVSKKGIGIKGRLGSAANPEVPVQDLGYETYGLSRQFLDSLGISGKLHPFVFVRRLCPSLREADVYKVFRMAGKILSIDVPLEKDGSPRGFAKIEYSHPIEAVQAVSLFNGQKLFSKVLMVDLSREIEKDRLPETLPEGLTGVGKGLGPQGKPLTNIWRTFNQLESGLDQDLVSTLNSGGGTNLTAGLALSELVPLLTLLAQQSGTNQDTIGLNAFNTGSGNEFDPNLLAVLNQIGGNNFENILQLQTSLGSQDPARMDPFGDGNHSGQGGRFGSDFGRQFDNANQGDGMDLFIPRNPMNDDLRPDPFFPRNPMNEDLRPDPFLPRNPMNEDLRPDPFFPRNPMNEDLRPDPFIPRNPMNEDLRPDPFIPRNPMNEDLRPDPFIPRNPMNEDLRPDPFIPRNPMNEDVRPDPFIPRNPMNEDLRLDPFLPRNPMNEDLRSDPFIPRNPMNEDLRPDPFFSKNSMNDGMQQDPFVARNQLNTEPRPDPFISRNSMNDEFRPDPFADHQNKSRILDEQKEKLDPFESRGMLNNPISFPEKLKFDPFISRGAQNTSSFVAPQSKVDPFQSRTLDSVSDQQKSLLLEKTQYDQSGSKTSLSDPLMESSLASRSLFTKEPMINPLFKNQATDHLKFDQIQKTVNNPKTSKNQTDEQNKKNEMQLFIDEMKHRAKSFQGQDSDDGILAAGPNLGQEPPPPKLNLPEPRKIPNPKDSFLPKFDFTKPPPIFQPSQPLQVNQIHSDFKDIINPFSTNRQVVDMEIDNDSMQNLEPLSTDINLSQIDQSSKIEKPELASRSTHLGYDDRRSPEFARLMDDNLGQGNARDLVKSRKESPQFRQSTAIFEKPRERRSSFATTDFDKHRQYSPSPPFKRSTAAEEFEKPRQRSPSPQFRRSVTAEFEKRRQRSPSLEIIRINTAKPRDSHISSPTRDLPIQKNDKKMDHAYLLNQSASKESSSMFSRRSPDPLRYKSRSRTPVKTSSASRETQKDFYGTRKRSITPESEFRKYVDSKLGYLEPKRKDKSVVLQHGVRASQDHDYPFARSPKKIQSQESLKTSAYRQSRSPIGQGVRRQRPISISPVSDIEYSPSTTKKSSLQYEPKQMGLRMDSLSEARREYEDVESRRFERGIVNVRSERAIDHYDPHETKRMRIDVAPDFNKKQLSEIVRDYPREISPNNYKRGGDKYIEPRQEDSRSRIKELDMEWNKFEETYIDKKDRRGSSQDAFGRQVSNITPPPKDLQLRRFASPSRSLSKSQDQRFDERGSRNIKPTTREKQFGDDDLNLIADPWGSLKGKQGSARDDIGQGSRSVAKEYYETEIQREDRHFEDLQLENKRIQQTSVERAALVNARPRDLSPVKRNPEPQRFKSSDAFWQEMEMQRDPNVDPREQIAEDYHPRGQNIPSSQRSQNIPSSQRSQNIPSSQRSHDNLEHVAFHYKGREQTEDIEFQNRGQERTEDFEYQNRGQKRIEDIEYQNRGQTRIEDFEYQNRGQKRIEDIEYQSRGQKRIEDVEYQNRGQKRIEDMEYPNRGQERSEDFEYQNRGQERTEDFEFQNRGQERIEDFDNDRGRDRFENRNLGFGTDSSFGKKVLSPWETPSSKPTNLRDEEDSQDFGIRKQTGPWSSENTEHFIPQGLGNFSPMTQRPQGPGNFHSGGPRQQGPGNSNQGMQKQGPGNFNPGNFNQGPQRPPTPGNFNQRGPRPQVPGNFNPRGPRPQGSGNLNPGGASGIGSKPEGPGNVNPRGPRPQGPGNFNPGGPQGPGKFNPRGPRPQGPGNLNPGGPQGPGNLNPRGPRPQGPGNLNPRGPQPQGPGKFNPGGPPGIGSKSEGPGNFNPRGQEQMGSSLNAPRPQGSGNFGQSNVPVFNKPIVNPFLQGSNAGGQSGPPSVPNPGFISKSASNAPPVPKPVEAPATYQSDDDTVMIRNLPLDMNINTLKELFSTCGIIKNAMIKGKGIGIVRFESPASTQKALSFDNTCKFGRIINVRCF